MSETNQSGREERDVMHRIRTRNSQVHAFYRLFSCEHVSIESGGEISALSARAKFELIGRDYMGYM